MTEAVLEADLTWVGSAFQPGVRVAIDPAGGPYTAVGDHRKALR